MTNGSINTKIREPLYLFIILERDVHLKPWIVRYDNNYESFYHGFMMGLFTNYKVKSNQESGEGRFDIEVIPRRINQTVIIIECKYSTSIATSIKGSEKVLEQIYNNHYLEGINKEGYPSTISYGISVNCHDINKA